MMTTSEAIDTLLLTPTYGWSDKMIEALDLGIAALIDLTGLDEAEMGGEG